MDMVYVGTVVLFFAASWGLVRLIGGGPGGASR